MAQAGATAQGYAFTTKLTNPTIYVYPSGQAELGTEAATRFPPSSTLTVAVMDAAGKPVAGVPVAFDVPQNSMLQGMVSIDPQQKSTGADGTVQATITPTPSATSGTGDVIVRVADKFDTVGVTLEQSKIRKTP
jgi:5-hydroxyisourate hydrolase-like protein (transthyretin family)